MDYLEELDDIILFCKTYSGDKDLFDTLINSIRKYNIDNIPLQVSVPDRDYNTFKGQYPNVDFVTDESIVGGTMVESWVKQQYVKMAYYKKRTAKYYVILDSDFEFIDKFKKSNFIMEDGTPKFVMHGNHDLFEWYRSSGKKHLSFDPRGSHFGENDKIHKELQFGGEILHYSAPFMFSHEVMRFLDYNLGIQHMMDKSPNELMWHGAGLRKYAELNEDFKYLSMDSMFKIYHYKEQYEEQYSGDDAIRHMGYKGKVIQSNWSK